MKFLKNKVTEKIVERITQEVILKAIPKLIEAADLVQHLGKEDVFFKVVPTYLGDLMTKYFRIEVEGLEHLPKSGSALIASNHSGFTGLDAFLLCHHIYQNCGRVPRVLIHHLWFINETTARLSQKMGFIEANYQNGLEMLQRKKMVIIFPEGENGNFKPTTQKYELQTFKSGMVRMALETNSPIIPTLVIGAEESNINLARLNLTQWIPGLKLPLPLNVIPLPARWKIKFLPPIVLERGVEAVSDPTYVRHTSQDIQDYMQIELVKEAKARKFIFI